ncbi:MAG: PASTA domain-containing protein [Ignavibacteria bacterium]|nr:PASTA domain-containing protein [Ignavibacteria bacterium]
MSTNKKILIISLVLIAGFSITIANLIKIQLFEHDKWESVAKKQTQDREYSKPLRGIIFDRNMKPLAINHFNVSVKVIPKRIKNADSVAFLLASALNSNKEKYLRILEMDTDYEVPLENNIYLENTTLLDEINSDGVIITKSAFRYYPYGKLASQIIGFTKNDKGKTGVEYTYERDLAGKCGMMIMQKDGNGNRRPFQGFRNQFPEPGSNIVLSIDINLQRILEEELEKGIFQSKSKSGKALIVSVKTGEILAMSSYPTYDPNNIKSSDTVGMKNRVITDQFDPGSTFKVITASGVLDKNLAGVNSEINTENGLYEFNGRVLKDEYGSSSMSFRKVIEKSSNIGVAKLSEMLGKNELFRYARNFGIGSYTGLELDGEVKGTLKHPQQFGKGTLQFMAIGYEVSVNLLQMAMVYQCIANSGIMMKPIIIKRLISSSGERINENYPVPVRQVISKKTSKIVTDLLEGVVNNMGTGTEAALEYITVAGKTGTTQFNTGDGYISHIHNSSFIGFYPAENPTVLVAVFLDEIKDEKFFGGLVAAPIFRRISKRLIDYVGIDRINSNDLFNEGYYKHSEDILNVTNLNNEIPDIKGMDLYNAVNILEERNIHFEIDGFSDKNKIPQKKYIVAEYSKRKKEGDIRYVSVKIREINRNEKNVLLKVPDVTGLSIRKAIGKLTSEGYSVEISGSGRVQSQIPEPGTELRQTRKIKLFCKGKKS